MLLRGTRHNAPIVSPQGFTLVELVVMVVIMGLLTTGVILLSSQYQARARDSVRYNDLEELRGAVVRYQSVQHQEAPSDDSVATLENALTQTFIPELPKDPGNQSYQYVRDITNYHKFFFGAQREAESTEESFTMMQSGPSDMDAEKTGTDGDSTTKPTNGIEFGF